MKFPLSLRVPKFKHWDNTIKYEKVVSFNVLSDSSQKTIISFQIVGLDHPIQMVNLFESDYLNQ
jgi:hypothetical protein